MLRNNLRILMAERGVNQKRLAAESGVSTTNISRILSGKVSSPGADVLAHIAAALDTTLDNLLNLPPPDSTGHTSTLAVVASGDPHHGVRLIDNPDDLLRDEGARAEFPLIHWPLPFRGTPDSYVATRMLDDSMAPLITRNSIVLIDTSQVMRNELFNQIVAVHIISHGVTIRVLREHVQPEVLFEAVNREWDRKHGFLTMRRSQFTILGKVVSTCLML